MKDGGNCVILQRGLWYIQRVITGPPYAQYSWASNPEEIVYWRTNNPYKFYFGKINTATSLTGQVIQLTVLSIIEGVVNLEQAINFLAEDDAQQELYLNIINQL